MSGPPSVEGTPAEGSPYGDLEPPPAVGPADVAACFREEGGRAVAVLARAFADLDLAEDAVQEAFTTALERWPRDGLPASPAGWVITTARRKALDRVRREALRTDKQAQAVRLAAATVQAPHDELEDEMAVVPDDRLALLLACCHPALAPESRVALTLRVLGGLTTGDIAAAFLVPESTMAQRISRAKAKIRDARIPFRVPDETELPGRLAGVLAVVYLVFTTGYAAPSGPDLTRPDLADEALRLGRVLQGLLPDEPEVLGLLALMLLTQARRPARTTPGGDVVLLADQDRSRWDVAMVADGQALVRRCLAVGRPGPYQLQAAIASLHCEEEVDWPQIAALYRRLACMAPSPVVEVNRAVALGMAGSPHAGLSILKRVDLDRYQPFHVAHAELLRRSGDEDAADGAYARAIELSANAVERAELERRRGSLRTSDPRR